MYMSQEKLEMFAALGVLALALCVFVTLVCAVIWFFDDCGREARMERRRTEKMHQRRQAWVNAHAAILAKHHEE